VKCSSDSSRAARAWGITASKKAAAMSPSSSRCRFFVKLVDVHTASSMPSPTNQR
jgi:hypothetical protein